MSLLIVANRVGVRTGPPKNIVNPEVAKRTQQCPGFIAITTLHKDVDQARNNRTGVAGHGVEWGPRVAGKNELAVILSEVNVLDVRRICVGLRRDIS